MNPGSGSGANSASGGKKSGKNAGSAANNSNSNPNNNNSDFGSNTLATITGQQLTVAASTPQGQTIQLVPLNVGHFQGTNLAAATQQWIIGQQRLANTNNPSNNSNPTTANGNSSNSTPTTSS